MRKNWIFLAIGIAAMCVGRSSLSQFGWSVYDYLQVITAQEHAPGVALVLVDQQSLDRMSEDEGYVFPWPRQFFGIAAVVAKEAGAKAVGYDILFTEPSRAGVEDDVAFSEMLKSSGLPIFMPAASKSGLVKEPVTIIKNSVSGLGAVHSVKQSGGVFRVVPNTIDEVETFAQLIYQRIFSGGSESAKPWLKFYSENAFPYVPFYNLVLAYRDLEEGRPLSKDIQNLKDRVWLVGYSAPGLYDLKPTPIDPQAPGIIVPATGLANRIDNSGLDLAGWWHYLAFSLLVCILCFAVVERISSPILASLFIIGAGVIGAAVSTLIMWRLHLWLDTVPLALGGLATGVSRFSWIYRTQLKEKLKLAKSLESSMSSDMVKLIRQGKIEVSRFGENREITILFSDLIGFTTLSEKLSADKLVEIMNWYLDEVVDLILRNNGYVDKFIGDAVMAIWNAPIEQSNHADLALKTAMEYEQVVANFNQKVKDKYGDLAELSARVGVHTGNAVVGNMGSKKRHNYTAIGDSVNLASRLEGMGKMYNSLLLVSEDCLSRVSNRPENIFEVDQVVVKGRSKPTRIYSQTNLNQISLIQDYHQALQKYYSGDWQGAKELFHRVEAIQSVPVLLERCEQAITQEVPANWKAGVWFHDSK